MAAKEQMSHISLICRDMTATHLGLPKKGKAKAEGKSPPPNKDSKEALKAWDSLLKPKISKKSFCFSHAAAAHEADGWNVFDPVKEFARQGVTLSPDDESLPWRQSIANTEFDLSAFDPPRLVVPQAVSDDLSFSLAMIHSRGRMPRLVWHNKNGSALVRSSEWFYLPENKLDLGAFPKILQAMFNKDVHIFIVLPSLLWTQSYPSDCPVYTQLILEDTFFLPKILKKIAALSIKGNLHSDTEILLRDWTGFVSQSLTIAVRFSESLKECRPVMIMGQGQGVLSALSAISQLLLDPFYRTLEGFCVLVEKEFIHFGHNFRDPSTSQRNEDHHSSIFLVFLDSTRQVIEQFPHIFQFTETLLLFLIDSVYSCQFGTFLPSSFRERSKFESTTASVWSFVIDHASDFINSQYELFEEPVTPQTEVESLSIWSGYFLRNRCRLPLLRADKHIRSSISQSLDVIDLSSFGIHSMPLSISSVNLEGITDLNLSNNFLQKLPSCLTSMRNLKSLCLSRNWIKSIEPAFWDIFTKSARHLEILDLSHNRMNELDGRVCQLESLKRLKISNNLLNNLSLAGLTQLIELNIEGNRFTEIPEELLSLSDLQELNIGNQEILILPDCFKEVSTLRTLNMSSTRIASLPPSFFLLKSLTALNISSGQIRQFPVQISELVGLTALSLSNCQLEEVPEYLESLPHLEALDLSHNNLRAVYQLEDISTLRSLHLGHNLFRSISHTIYKFDRLEELYLNNNHLIELHSGLGNMPELRTLSIDSNEITALPGILGHLQKLERSGQFTFANNHFGSPLSQIASEGTPKLFEYLRSLLEGDEVVNHANFIIVGQDNIEKTFLYDSLVCLMINGKPKKISSRIAEELPKLMESRLFGYERKLEKGAKKKEEIQYCIKVVSGNEIWENFRPLFFSNPAVFIVVWSLTDLEESRIDDWLQSVESYARDVPILMVGTHTSNPICTEEFINKIITSLKNKFLGLYPNIVFLTVDCANCKGLNQLAVKVFNIAASPPFLKMIIPRSFFHLNKLLVDPIYEVTWQELSLLGSLCNIHCQQTLIKAAEWLSYTNNLIVFRRAKTGEIAMVFHNQRWLLEIIRAMITINPLFRQKGAKQDSQPENLEESELFRQGKLHLFELEAVSQWRESPDVEGASPIELNPYDAKIDKLFRFFIEEGYFVGESRRKNAQSAINH